MESSINRVYDDLLERIVNLSLLPGEKISENKMSEQYGVSRTVVRGAFHKLQQIDFLEIRPRSGTFITKIDFEYIRSAMLLRLALEKELMERIIANPREKAVLIKKLKESFKKQKSCVSGKEDMIKFNRYDNEFHGAIYDGHNGTDTKGLVNSHLLHFARWRNLTLKYDVSLDEIMSEHEDIIRFSEEGDIEKLRRILDKHINRTVYSIFSSGEGFASYFK